MRLPGGPSRYDFAAGLASARRGIHVPDLGLPDDVDKALDVAAATVGEEEQLTAIGAARATWRHRRRAT